MIVYTGDRGKGFQKIVVTAGGKASI